MYNIYTIYIYVLHLHNSTSLPKQSLLDGNLFYKSDKNATEKRSQCNGETITVQNKLYYWPIHRRPA
jgi:hypothetical protein